MNGKKFLWKGLALGLCLAMALSACGDKGATTPSPTAAPTPAPSDTPDTPTDYRKYNTYIDLADEMGEIEEILTVYFNNVAYQEEFAVLAGGDYANIKEAVQFYTGMSYTVEKALQYAAEEPSYPEADEAVLALGDSPDRVMTALNHLGSYMRFDDFVDDDMARAPELHAELWAALETYDAYYPAFITALSTLAEQGEEDSMNELLEAGEAIRYNARAYIQTAEDILDSIWIQLEQAAVDADPDAENIDLPNIDMTELSPLFAQFQTAYDDLTAALSDESEQEKVSAFTGKLGEETLKLYTRRVDSLYVKMGALAEAVMAGNEYAEAYNDASDAVSDMITSYNSVN